MATAETQNTETPAIAEAKRRGYLNANGEPTLSGYAAMHALGLRDAFNELVDGTLKAPLVSKRTLDFYDNPVPARDPNEIVVTGKRPSMKRKAEIASWDAANAAGKVVDHIAENPDRALGEAALAPIETFKTVGGFATQPIVNVIDSEIALGRRLKEGDVAGATEHARTAEANAALAAPDFIPVLGPAARAATEAAPIVGAGMRKGWNAYTKAVEPFIPEPNQMNMFIGPKAKTWDAGRAAKAAEMEASGASRDDIWKETQTYRGVDGKWRQEIDDSQAFMKGGDVSASESARRWGPSFVGDYSTGAVAHPELAAAYPELRDVTLQGHPGVGGTYESGHLLLDDVEHPWGGRISVGNNYRGADKTSVALHEGQHAIQRIENTAKGGAANSFTQQDEAQMARDAMTWRREMEIAARENPGADRSALDNIVAEKYAAMGASDWVPSRQARDVALDLSGNPDSEPQKIISVYELDKRVSPPSPREMYRRLAGETEARNVQTRRNFSMKERAAKPPWTTQDVPDDQQIVRFDGGDAQMAASARNTFIGRGMAGAESPIIKNPSYDDLMRLTAKSRDPNAFNRDRNTLRFIKDDEGNTYVFSAEDMIHDQAASSLMKQGVPMKTYQFGDDLNDGRGVIVRKGDQFESVSGEPLPVVQRKADRFGVVSSEPPVNVTGTTRVRGGAMGRDMKGLLDQGKTPEEIAAALRMSPEEVSRKIATTKRNARALELRAQMGRNAPGKPDRLDNSINAIVAILKKEGYADATRAMVSGVFKRADDAARASGKAIRPGIGVVAPATVDDVAAGAKRLGMSPERYAALSARGKGDTMKAIAGAAVPVTAASVLSPKEGQAQEVNGLPPGAQILPDGSVKMPTGAPVATLDDGTPVFRQSRPFNPNWTRDGQPRTVHFSDGGTGRATDFIDETGERQTRLERQDPKTGGFDLVNGYDASEPVVIKPNREAQSHKDNRALPIIMGAVGAVAGGRLGYGRMASRGQPVVGEVVGSALGGATGAGATAALQGRSPEEIANAAGIGFVGGPAASKVAGALGNGVRMVPKVGDAIADTVANSAPIIVRGMKKRPSAAALQRPETVHDVAARLRQAEDARWNQHSIDHGPDLKDVTGNAPLYTEDEMLRRSQEAGARTLGALGLGARLKRYGGAVKVARDMGLGDYRSANEATRAIQARIEKDPMFAARFDHERP